MKYFSLSKYGFFDSAVHKTLPSDAIALTDEQYATLLDKPQGKKYDVVDGVVCFVNKIITVEQVGATRDRLFEGTRWRVERYMEEVSLGIYPTEDITPVLEYRQALRDITTQEGFPQSVIWPSI